MKKLFRTLIIAVMLILIVGCGKKDATKTVSYDYIKENNGVVFGEYAIAIDEKYQEGPSYAVFKEKTYNRYQRIFKLENYDTSYRLLASDKYLYTINNCSISAYNLNSNLNKVKMFIADFDILKETTCNINKIYGFYEEYIYLDLYKNQDTKEITCLKIKEDLSSYEILENSESLPEGLDNYIEK